ncbi:tail assembly K domain protein [Escherichia coli DEC11C]|nr:tail assembly K domain protein [Escherichia coli DEC11C]
MVGIPEQRVTVRHPVLKAPSCQMWHTAEFMNFPPADQPPGQCTFYLQPPVGLAQPGQTTGMTVDQCHNLPLPSLPARQSSGAIRKYASGSAEIFTQGIYRSPSGVLTTKPHDSAGTHRRACARIADSVCVIGFTAKVC